HRSISGRPGPLAGRASSATPPPRVNSRAPVGKSRTEVRGRVDENRSADIEHEHAIGGFLDDTLVSPAASGPPSSPPRRGRGSTRHRLQLQRRPGYAHRMRMIFLVVPLAGCISSTAVPAAMHPTATATERSVGVAIGGAYQTQENATVLTV